MKYWLELFWKETVTALSDGCSSEGEGEGFSAYHELEKATALSRAV